jgi:hypothetical protein
MTRKNDKKSKSPVPGLANGLKGLLTEALNSALEDMFYDDVVNESVDKYVQDFFDRDTKCYLRFHEAQIDCGFIVSDSCIGACGGGPVEIDIETYDMFGGPRGDQIDDVKEQIAGIDKLMSQLLEAKADLEKALNGQAQK